MALANQISLLSYLQYGPPLIPIIHQNQRPDNTKSNKYSAVDIAAPGHWAGFSLTNIRLQYGQFLLNIMIFDDAAPTSPVQAINSENGVRERFGYYLKARLRHALDRGFQQLVANQELGELRPLQFGEGELAEMIDNFKPDTAYFDPTLTAVNRENRCPGDLKPSYK